MNGQILNHLKTIEEVVALDIINDFEDVKTIEFTDVSQIEGYFESPGSSERFNVLVLVNGEHEMNYQINLSVNEFDDSDDEDATSSLYRLQSWTPSKRLKSKKNKERVLTIADLEKEAYQKQLNRIDIRYYLKNDIYKIK